MKLHPSPESAFRRTVDETIASGFRLLRFPAAIEQMFERETGEDRRGRLMVGSVIGMLLYDLYLIVDWLVTPDIFAEAVVLRLGVVDVGILAAILVYRARPPVFVRETVLVVVGGFLTTAVHLYLMLLSRSPLHTTQHFAIPLILMFLTIVQRGRFWYLVPAYTGVLILYVGALMALPGYPGALRFSATITMVYGILFSLFAAYSLEHEARLSYLLKLRTRMHVTELDALSRNDPLTGLGNRRELDGMISAWQIDHVAGESCAFAVLDIDHFKLFNDALGHQAGDVCLKRVAGIVRSQLRAETDEAFRFGGEEFVIACRTTDLDAAFAIVERMRAAVERAAIPHPGLGAGAVVTVSIGVAAGLLGQRRTISAIIGAADKALYVAKRDGRNRVRA